jgi:SAM-dependent methyltransferase
VTGLASSRAPGALADSSAWTCYCAALMTSSSPCRICGNVLGNRSHLAREMMYGTREVFEYVECGACGCLQIADVPADLARHYSGGYYSLDAPTPKLAEGLRRRLRHAQATHAFGRPSAFGWLASAFSTPPKHRRWLRLARAGFDSRILDVGSGAGRLLSALHSEGYRHLTGVDPHIPETLELAPGLRILKGDVRSLEETFDVVMANHSLEHIPDQAATMDALRRLVAPGGTVLVRIPLCGTHAWRTYGVSWAQLDAPRHLYLHTERSLRLLAERSGLEVGAVQYDSTEFQFWASEQYQADIPLRDPRSLDARSWLVRHSRRIRSLKARAKALNAARDGDQACFYLTPGSAGSAQRPT